jgi:hypothetical protein
LLFRIPTKRGRKRGERGREKRKKKEGKREKGMPRIGTIRLLQQT